MLNPYLPEDNQDIDNLMVYPEKNQWQHAGVRCPKCESQETYKLITDPYLGDFIFECDDCGYRKEI